MGGYGDTIVEKSAILLPKIEQNDGFLYNTFQTKL